MQQKRLTPSEARQKIYRYCAYQERSHQEVKDKLYSYGLYGNEVDEILAHLITEGFLNEERFARAFVRGKFRMQKWGRVKLQHELEARGLTKNCIRAGMKEIEDQEYLNTLHDLLQKKSGQLEEENDFLRRDKLARYVIQKGFESDLVWTILKEKF